MDPQVIRLPDGQAFIVKPQYGGFFFSSTGLNGRHSLFPSGWLLNIHTEDSGATNSHSDDSSSNTEHQKPAIKIDHIHKFTKATLQNDTVFISSLSMPSGNDYLPSSTSRHIALLMWISLYWYFQQPEPAPQVETAQSRHTPAEAKPRAEWRIRVKREGVLGTRNIIPKLERMGLISTMEPAVGTDDKEGWDQMFVTRQGFWQIPFGLFLFNLQPKRSGSSYPGSPMSSRAASPARNMSPHIDGLVHDVCGTCSTESEVPSVIPAGPYYSASRQPTYYPPPPLQYTFTTGMRHPRRPKPPRMGEIFYTRFVPSVGKYLSFRVASSSSNPVPYLGPVGPKKTEHAHLTAICDTSLLKMWLSNPRVNEFWGDFHPSFLTDGLKSQHSFPVIGMWDGAPFGYFEIYWVMEDPLGRQMGREAEDWDRGLHVLVGEEWARGTVPTWLSSLVHWCWQADNRTMNVCLEPRVDNKKFIVHLEREGFSKRRQVTFPHKQAWLVQMPRDVWRGPAA